MLFIYSALVLGGIETFFVRLAKERHKKGLITKILLLSSKGKSDKHLLEEMQKYAQVYYVNDLFFGLQFISRIFILLSPIKNNQLKVLLQGIKQIHVSTGWTALLADRLIKRSKRNIILTVGFYHSLEFSWVTKNGWLPYFEKVNRRFVLNHIPKSNLLVFSNSIIDLYKIHAGVDLSGAQTFRIGVVNKLSNDSALKKYTESNIFRICSVGRLTDFKTYNLWMIDVVYDLKNRGINIVYDIYGEGVLKERLQKKIIDLKLQSCINLKNSFKYSEFNNVVKEYDVFIGSGTAIIQASSIGVCSIIGIESIAIPETYGFFSDCSDVDYNIDGLSLRKQSVSEMLERFHHLDIEKKKLLSKKHLQAMEEFYIETCSLNFEKLSSKNNYKNFTEVNYIGYQLSVIYNGILYKVFKIGCLINRYHK